MNFPRIHLAVDNCFASKRWTAPEEWMQIIHDAGARLVEASADTECDPLYTPPGVLNEWVEQVQVAAQRLNMRVANLYSGHGTYTTLGLAHPDRRVADHIQHQWLEPMIRHAGTLGAGLGFYCHAFSQATLQNSQRYAEAQAHLYRRLAELAAYASDSGVGSLAVEQMYTPHQIPWTIDGTRELLRRVKSLGNAVIYTTLDVGHQVGQRRYQRPTRTQLEAYFNVRTEMPDLWLGYFAEQNADVDAAIDYIDQHAYLFADPRDSDLYAWIEQLGAYSPIIHLQQTDGTSSAHRPFTDAYNRIGIVEPARVLVALRQAYQQPNDASLPPPCADIVLTLEIFSGTAERPNDILRSIRESVAYWRAFIPADGIPLDQLVR